MQDYFDQAKNLHHCESATASRLSEEIHQKKLDDLGTQLRDYELDENDLEKKLSAVRAGITHVRAELQDIEATPTLAPHELDSLSGLRIIWTSTNEDLLSFNWQL